MLVKDTSPKDRVNRAIAFHKPDRTPRDFAAVPEVREKLKDWFGAKDRKEVLKRLSAACRIVSYDSFCRPPEIDLDEVDLNVSLERSSVGGMWERSSGTALTGISGERGTRKFLPALALWINSLPIPWNPRSPWMT